MMCITKYRGNISSEYFRAPEILSFSAIFLAVVVPTALKKVSEMMSLNPVKTVSWLGLLTPGKAKLLTSLVNSKTSESISSASLKSKNRNKVHFLKNDLLITAVLIVLECSP